MRQGQQNRRGRGRNRKGQSPLTRSFESTGPDVKIRGTPAHIAEKYMSLARDATSSGDPVLAENYLQHAEHYNRIIMAFRDQHMGPGGEMNGGMARHRPFMTQDSMDPGDEFADEDGEEGDVSPPQPAMRPQEPQPRTDGQRFEGQRGGHEPHRFRDRSDRHERGGEQRGYSPGRQQHGDAGADGPSQQPSPDAQMRRRERFPQAHEQPEFLRRPVRRPRREGNGGPGDANGVTEEPDRD
jgi:hypothetical protein